MFDYLKKNKLWIGVVLVVFIVLIFVLVLFNDNKDDFVEIKNINDCDISLKYTIFINDEKSYSINLNDSLKEDLINEFNDSKFKVVDDANAEMYYELKICDTRILFGYENDNAIVNDKSVKLGDKHTFLIDLLKETTNEDKVVYLFENNDDGEELIYIDLKERQQEKIVEYWQGTDLTPQPIDLAILGEYVLDIEGEVILFDKGIGYVSYRGEIIEISSDFSEYLSSIIRANESVVVPGSGNGCCSCCPELKPGESCIAKCCDCYE